MERDERGFAGCIPTVKIDYVFSNSGAELVQYAGPYARVVGNNSYGHTHKFLRGTSIVPALVSTMECLTGLHLTDGISP